MRTRLRSDASFAKICDMLEVVALYMFGYFAIRCHDSKNFWAGLNCEQVLWSLFMDFARQIKDAQREFSFKRKRFRRRVADRSRASTNAHDSLCAGPHDESETLLPDSWYCRTRLLSVQRILHNGDCPLQLLDGTAGHTPSLESDRQRAGGQRFLQRIQVTLHLDHWHPPFRTDSMSVSEQAGAADATPVVRPEQPEMVSPESPALPCGLRLPAVVSPGSDPTRFNSPPRECFLAHW